MANPINHVRMQRALAAFFLVIVLAGSVAGALRAFRATGTAQPVAVSHHAKPPKARR